MRVLSAFVLLLATFGLVTGATAPSATVPATEDGRGSRCVLVTGANRGLGLEFARQYRAAGWRVIGTARRPDKADELRGTGAEVVQLDVADAKSVARLARDLAGRPIDLLINNAGIGSRTPSIEGFDAERAERVLSVNLLGPMRVTSALLPNLRAGVGKQIVAVSSGLASIANNKSARYYGYRESKAGLNMFMRSLAAELRPEGFVCVALSPGWVRTDMGGAEAPLSPKQSITGLRKVIDGLNAERSGRFFNHDGSELKW